MRDKIEVELSVALVLDNTSVNTRTFTWVKIVLSSLVEKSVLNVTVDKAVDNLGLVSWSCVFKHVSNNFNLPGLDFSSHCRATHSISVDNDLVRKRLSFLIENSYCIIDKLSYNLGSLFCNNLLLSLSPFNIVLFSVLFYCCL